jgi:hypothetical protein
VPSSNQHRWILVATNYFTKWIEAIPTRKANHIVIINFLQENIFSRFGCPKRIVTDNAIAFNDKHLVKLCEELVIQLVHVGAQKFPILIHLSLHHSSHFITPLTFHDIISINMLVLLDKSVSADTNRSP